MSKLFKKLICCLFVGLCSIAFIACDGETPDNQVDCSKNPEHEDCQDPGNQDKPGEENKPSIKDNYECITIAEAIELATTAGDAGTSEKYYVYGTIKEVSNGMYGEMTIIDETGELYVYGVYSKDETTRYDAMADKPVKGDEVVLLGMLKTYKGKPEMDRGYLQEFKHVEKDPVNPDKPNDQDKPSGPSIKDNYECITIAEAIELATTAGDAGTSEKYYVYGTIKEVSNGMYGEMTIIDETGELYVYGVYSKDETTRYDAMADKPVKGDEVVLLGMLKTYKGKPEMDRGYLQEFKHVEVEVDEKEYVPTTVKVAREAEVGEKFKLTGVVSQITYAFGMVPNGFYLVDNTGSIYIYGKDAAGAVSEGNTVTVIGEKTYYVLDSEKANAEKFGYKGACQLQNATVVANDKGNTAFDKSWIEESTVKDIMETPATENITTNIYKVIAQVKKVEGKGFVNYYFNDLDGVTGSYAYTSCSGDDFSWLDEFDGKLCTVYLSPINAKSTASGCLYRFVPIEVLDEGFTFPETDASKYVVVYHGLGQFLNKYDADPAIELLTSVTNNLIGIENIPLTYSSSDTNVAYFEEVNGKVIFHTKNAGTATIKVSSSYAGVDYSAELEVVVNEAKDYETITVKEAFDTADGEVVTVKGIVAGSLVNQSGFYLVDETGVIAVKSSSDVVALLSVGDEVVIKGTKGHQQKSGYTGPSIGQNNIYDAEVLVNYYGNHEYSTASFKTGKTVEELYELDPTVDYSGDVYIVEAIVEVTETNFYTSIQITGVNDKSIKMSLYCSSANQYSFLKQYAGETVTLELAMCNWNSKSYYTGCVISVTKDGVKTNNTLNFTNK